MRKRFFVVLAAFGLTVAAPASTFDFVDNAVAVTAVAATVTVGTAARPMASITIINDGTDEVYARFFRTGETITPAVAGSNNDHSYLIPNGASYKRGSPRTEGSPGYVAVSLVCTGGETATVRVWAAVR